MKNLLIFAILIFPLFGIGFGLKTKSTPDHIGVDVRAQGLLDEYFKIALQKNIKFTNKVTIGFKKFNKNNIVGRCTYGNSWREIDFDENYWNQSSAIEKRTLEWHELTHCYCGRKHDYGVNQEYTESIGYEVEKFLNMFDFTKYETPKPGFMKDGCPKSLMYPIIVDDKCVKKYYSGYVNEMFERCNPY